MAFQISAFQPDAFQIDNWVPLDPPAPGTWVPLQYDTIGAFQNDAFQNDAFQVSTLVWVPYTPPTATWTPLT